MKYDVGGLQLDRPFRVRRLGHFGFHTNNVNDTVEFMTGILGLSISDTEDFSARSTEPISEEDARAWFLRLGSDHHTVVLGSQNLLDKLEPARAGQLVNQMSWQVGTLQEVSDGMDFIAENATLRRIGRDAPGSNWHSYAYDPDGYVIEIFYGIEQIGWDGKSKPRSMYDRGFTTRPDLPQIPEYQEVDQAAARGDDVHAGYRYEEARRATFNVDGILLPRPFKLTRLAKVGVFVEDVESSTAFYRDVLGLAVSERVTVNGHDCVYLRADSEHHSLALYPAALRDVYETEGHSFGVTCGFAIANYRQLKDAYQFFVDNDVKILDLPPQLSPGVKYGFWIQGPNKVAIEIFYGMDRVGLDGSVTAKSFPPSVSEWPDSITHGGAGWYDLPLMGPFA